MGYGNSYDSSKTSGGSKSTTYESSKASSKGSSKSSSYDSSKVGSNSSSVSTTAKGQLGDIKRLLVNYLDLCQEIEDKQASLDKLIEKRDALRAKIASHPQASAIDEIISLIKTPKNSNKR